MKRIRSSSALSVLGIGLGCVLLSQTALWGAAQKEPDVSTTEEPITVSLLLLEGPQSPINENAPVYQEIFKRTGIKLKIEPVPLSDFTSKTRLLMGTGQVPDIMRVYLSDVRDFAASGIFLPLVDNVKKHAPNMQRVLDADPQWKKVMLDKELYFFPYLQSPASASNRAGWQGIVRVDLLKSLNLSMPDSFEDLYQSLKRMKAAHPDSRPWTNLRGTWNLVRKVSYPLGSGPKVYWDDDIQGGKWIYGAVTPEFKDRFLAYFNRLYKEGVLDPDFPTNTDDDLHERISSGKSFFAFEYYGFVTNTNPILKAKSPDAGFWIVPTLKNSAGQRRNVFWTKDWPDRGYAISAKTKYPVRLVKFMDWLLSKEGSDLTNYGVEGVHYTRKDGAIVVAADLVERFKSASQPDAALASYLGSGFLQFTLLSDQNPRIVPPGGTTAADERKMFAENVADKGFREPVLEPPFTAAERDKLKSYTTAVETIMMPAIEQFITGALPLSDFEKVAKRAIDAGALEIEAIYNAAEARIR